MDASDVLDGLYGVQTSQVNGANMLVLSRKAGQRIVISDEITITVLSVQGSHVRLGVDAPPSIVIRRSELPAWPPVRVGGVLLKVEVSH